MNIFDVMFLDKYMKASKEDKKRMMWGQVGLYALFALAIAGIYFGINFYYSSIGL